eukprot:TRINITY_DN2153_c0_g3_i1.p1 TRINITY_DN2153_c0_g3~~TRINITY_DN2153_c0_g3_i1.p1  ORF type:complete len:649 (+),score=238.00 TRINITY_DN2153_c0_g3_i1:74-2020(+)
MGADDKGEYDRGAGVSQFDYFISLMGYAIGIGNVWRFPYLVGRHGGCAFLVAYVIMLLFVSSPCYLMELVWGNTTRKSTIGTFKCMHPKYVGVAWAAAVMLFFVLPYYNMLLAYAMVYLVNSFKDPLPWTADAYALNELPAGMSASDHFWNNEILGRYTKEEIVNADFGLGGVQWHLAVGLLMVWLIVFLALFRGMEASAKVTYVTVGLPLLCMVVMFIRAVTLPGASDGIQFYIGKFEVEKLFGENARGLWADACSQILFSLSPGMGTAITLSSYTRPKEDVYKINLLVTLCNSAFSIFSGFAVFSIVGFMSHHRCSTEGLTCATVDEIAGSGTGLAFVTLAEGVAQFGAGSNFFAALFYIMLLTLGLDSTFAWVETINTYIGDWAQDTGRKITKAQITCLTAVMFYLVGLFYCTRLGMTLLDVVDHFAGSSTMIVVVIMEVIMFRLHWGWDRLQDSVTYATKGPKFPEGRKVPLFWKIALYYTALPLAGAVFLNRLITDFEDPYENYPGGIQALGWISLLTSIACIPASMALYWNHEPDPLPQQPEFEGDQPLLRFDKETNQFTQRGNESNSFAPPPQSHAAAYEPPRMASSEPKHAPSFAADKELNATAGTIPPFPEPPADAGSDICPIDSIAKMRRQQSVPEVL